MQDQALRLRELASGQRLPVPGTNLVALRGGPRVIAVTSGKGGVGKTNVTINLGLALARRGQRVVIVDGDLGMANVTVALGVSSRYTLYDVLLGQKTLDEVMVTCPFGLRVVPGGSGIAELANLDERQRGRLLSTLSRMGNETDVVLIDTSAGISRNVLAFSLAADTVVVVTVPEPTAIADAYGIIKALKGADPKVDLQLVVNRARSPREGKAVHDRLSLVCRRFLGSDVGRLGTVAEDPAVPEAVRRQSPVLLAFPQSRAARDVERLPEALFGDLRGRPGGIRGFVDRLAGWFR